MSPTILKVVRQLSIPIEYRGTRLRGNLRLDILAEDKTSISRQFSVQMIKHGMDRIIL